MFNQKKDEGSKAKWDPTPVMKNGLPCGTKIFDLLDENQRKCCANELICRYYLNKLNYDIIARLGDIEPQSVNSFICSLTVEDIRAHFDEKLEETAALLKTLPDPAENTSEVKMYIELGDNNVREYMEDLAKNYSYKDNSQEIRSIMIQLFSMLDCMHSTGFINADLKPGNLLFRLKNGKRTLVMNDFDSSFILREKTACKKLKSPRGSRPHISPELSGLFDKNIGIKTDIFVAGLISYQLLNNWALPDEFNIASDKFEQDLFRRYSGMQKNGKSFAEPLNGSNKLKSIILKALSIDPESRPDTETILKELTSAEPASAVPAEADTHSSTEPSQNFFKHFKSLIRSYTLIVALIVAGFVAFAVIFGNVLSKALDKNDHGASSSKEVPITTAAETSALSSEPETISVSAVTETEVPATEPVTESVEASSEELTTETAALTAVSTTEVTEPVQTSTVPTTTTAASTTTTTTTTTASVTTVPVTTTVSDYNGSEVLLHSENRLYSDVSGFEIRGFNKPLPSKLVIPSEINGVPVVSIAADAFSGCNIEEVVIPDTVVNIGDRAFCNCPELRSIYLGSRVSMIGEKAFFNNQYNGWQEPEITVTNPNHRNCEDYFGAHWDGREHDYIISFSG